MWHLVKLGKFLFKKESVHEHIHLVKKERVGFNCLTKKDKRVRMNCSLYNDQKIILTTKWPVLDSEIYYHVITPHTLKCIECNFFLMIFYYFVYITLFVGQ